VPEIIQSSKSPYSLAIVGNVLPVLTIKIDFIVSSKRTGEVDSEAICWKWGQETKEEHATT